MLFPTVEYAIFFLAVLAIAWPLAGRLQTHKLFLLGASYVFYGFWSWRYVPLLIAVSAFAGVVARAIQRSDDALRRKQYLTFGVVVCLLVLAYYKYLGFLWLSLIGLFGMPQRFVPAVGVTPFLPLGISFFVFHAISLIGDVYKRKLHGRLAMLDALLYVAFFPQLIAGPILRASKFIPQLCRPRDPFAHPREPGVSADREWPVQEGGAFEHARDAAGGAGVCRAGQLPCGRCAAGGLRLRGGDLLRFLRLHGHRHGLCTPARVSLSAELQRSLHGGRSAGVLAALAHLALHLAAGLPVHSAWRLTRGAMAHGRQPDDHDAARRPVARGVLDVCDVGRADGRVPGGAQTLGTVAGRAAAAGAALVDLGVTVLLFHAVCLGWIFFRSPTFSVAGAVLHQLGSRGAVTLASWPVVATLLVGLLGQYAPRVWRRGMEATMSRLPVVASGALLAAGVCVIELLGPTGVAPFIYFQF